MQNIDCAAEGPKVMDHGLIVGFRETRRVETKKVVIEQTRKYSRVRSVPTRWDSIGRSRKVDQETNSDRKTRRD